MLTKIKSSLIAKDEASFNEAVNELVMEIGSQMDEHTRNAFVKTFQYSFKNEKGRIASPFTEVKESVVGGKRGRPALSEVEKAESLKAKLQAQLDALNSKIA